MSRTTDTPRSREDAAGVGRDTALFVRGSRRVLLRHLNQLWWREEGLRKRDALVYYRAVGRVLLPHLRDRPFTLRRHYNGPRSPFEWIKDAPPELPDWVSTVVLPARSRRGGVVRYALVNDLPTLLWMVDFGCVDLHVWTSRADLPDRPDHVLFDLDPAGVGFADVVRAALLLREALAALALEALVSTTGGDGLHVRVPIVRRHTHAEARDFAQVVAGAVARSSDGLVTLERDRSRRRGVFVDTKMNGHGQQVVAVYSIRPLAGAPVATPLRWEELGGGLDPRSFTPRTVPDRLERLGDVHDPRRWPRQRLGTALARLER
jgi:bifunctional non-homologous end joining protein LigD